MGKIVSTVALNSYLFSGDTSHFLCRKLKYGHGPANKTYAETWKFRFRHRYFLRKLRFRPFPTVPNKSSCQSALSEYVKTNKSFKYKLQMSIPGLYVDIGKKAIDLLYKDYGQQPPVHFHYQSFDSSFDLSCQCKDIVPGLSTVFRFIIPDSGKVEVRYLHDYAGIAAGIGLKAYPHNVLGFDPIVNFSGVVGCTLFSLGTDVAFDMTTRTFNNYNAGLSFNGGFLNASLTLNDKFDTIKASYYQELNPLTRTAIAAELKHSFSNNGTTAFTVGTQHALFPSTLVKARIDTDGKLGALVRQGFWQKFSLSIAGEVDFRSTSWIPKIGLSMAFRL